MIMKNIAFIQISLHSGVKQYFQNKICDETDCFMCKKTAPIEYR